MRQTSYSGQTRQDSRILPAAAAGGGNQPLAVRDAPQAQRDLPETVNGEFVSRKLFPDAGCVGVGAERLLVDVDDRGRASGGGDELSRVAGEVPAPILRWWERHTRSTAVQFTIVGVAPAGFIGANITSWGVPGSVDAGRDGAR